MYNGNLKHLLSESTEKENQQKKRNYHLLELLNMFIFDSSVWSFSMTKLKPWTDAMKNNLFLLPAPQKRNSGGADFDDFMKQELKFSFERQTCI